MRGTLMTGIAAACGLAMTLACGPGNVAPPGDDDAQGDDDAVTDDDLTGDDDAAVGGTGTISVTVEVLAVLAEGQSVEAEIVVDSTPTGITAPAEIEVDSGPHTITLKTNEPSAPAEQRFVAAPHEIVVARNSTAECGMFLGRDLGGMWQPAEDWPVPNDDPREVEMWFGADPFFDADPTPCPSAVWIVAPGFGLCLLEEDHLWAEYPNPNPGYSMRDEGSILDNGRRIEYMTDDGPDGGGQRGPWVLTRVEE